MSKFRKTRDSPNVKDSAIRRNLGWLASFWFSRLVQNFETLRCWKEEQRACCMAEVAVSVVGIEVEISEARSSSLIALTGECSVFLSIEVTDAAVFHFFASFVPYGECGHRPRTDATKRGGCGGGGGHVADALAVHGHGCSVVASRLHPRRPIGARHEHRPKPVTPISLELRSFRVGIL